jgi:hypothetical protein
LNRLGCTLLIKVAINAKVTNVCQSSESTHISVHYGWRDDWSDETHAVGRGVDDGHHAARVVGRNVCDGHLEGHNKIYTLALDKQISKE